MQTILSLENVHKGGDIYVVCSGKSLDYIKPSFFDGRIVIGVNLAYKIVPVTYTVFRDGPVYPEQITTIASEHIAGDQDNGRNIADYVFKCARNLGSNIDTENTHPRGDKIIQSYSTVTSAMHLAAFMGARAIFLVAHDCGPIDEIYNCSGYYDNEISDKSQRRMEELESQSMAVRDYIIKNYGCVVHSINPFVSLALEGHTYGRVK
mgnify:FL=1